MTNPTLERYWAICLLKESPENTPYSISRIFLSGIILAVLMVIEWNYSDFTASEDIGNTIFTAACMVWSYFIYTYIVLFLRGFSSRIVQTAICLYCTSIVIHLLVVPLLFLAPFLTQISAKNPILLFLGVIYLFLSLGLSVWQFVITAHIYKHALSTTSIQSVLTAFGLIAVNILTISLLQ